MIARVIDPAVEQLHADDDAGFRCKRGDFRETGDAGVDGRAIVEPHLDCRTSR